MNSVRTLTAAALLALYSCGAASQAHRQSLAEAYEHAAASRLSVRVAGAEVETVRARVAQARAGLYPTIDLIANADLTKNFDTYTGTTATVQIPQLNIDSIVQVTQSVPRYQTTWGLQLQHQLYDGGRTRAQVERQELALQAAELSNRLVLQDVAFEVSHAFFRLRRACLEHDAGLRRAARARALAEAAAQRLQDGRISNAERSAAELVLAERMAALRTHSEEVEIAEIELAATQGEAAAPAEPARTRCVFASEPAADLAYAMQLADGTLEERQQRYRIQAAREAVEVERAALKPQLSLNARFVSGARSDNSLGDGVFNMSRRLVRVGLQLSFNLFDGDLARERMAESRSELRRIGLQAERAAGEREQASRRAAIRLRMADSRLELARVRLAMAREQAVQSRERLANGTGTAAAAEERADREADAQDELRLAEVDQALARLINAFPASPLSSRAAPSGSAP